METTPKKKGRTNTPWTAEEEQRLKQMRDLGKSWSEIAKVRCDISWERVRISFFDRPFQHELKAASKSIGTRYVQTIVAQFPFSTDSPPRTCTTLSSVKMK